ncbi:MAG: glycosyl transferase family 1, partial [Bacteroidales bacterium]|nr:glycosyl transferase family 1 [Bacteroidales bacterium]
MKILHTISGMSAKCGGTASCTYELVKGMQSHSNKVDILTFEPEAGDKLIGTDNFIETVSNSKHFISKTYKNALQNSDYQLYHTNGIWQYTELITAKIARKKRVPYIISPHGMLYPQALAVSRLKKRLFLKLFLMNDLQKAAAVHATCTE